MKPETISAITILAIAAYIDWKEHRVPNWLTYSAWMLGLLFHGMNDGWAGFGSSLWGSAIGLATLIVPYALRGMGAGDVKLMAAVGAWVGAVVTLQAFLWIAVVGGAMGLYSIVRSKQVRDRMLVMVNAGRNLFTLKPMEQGVMDCAPQRILLPYGVPIAIGFYVYFMVGGLV